MTARVGLGLLISALLSLAAWLTVSAVGAAAEPPTTTDARAGVAAAVAVPMVPGAGATPEAGAGNGAPDASAAADGDASSVSASAGTPSALAAIDAVDAAWTAGIARATGIPQRAVVGYAGAALALAAEQPSCGLGWNTVAALGWIESGHGTHAGSSIGAGDGVVSPRILGPALDGGEFDAIADTDGGALDGDGEGDRAVGPMQFIPSTWQSWGADGSGDGVADPQQVDDAALAAARYLCHYGDLTDPVAWRTAVFAYNHVESYVDSVAATANQYAAQAASVPVTGGAR